MKFMSGLFKAIKNDPNILGRLILILIVIGVLITAMVMSGPKPIDQDSAALTPTPLASEFILPSIVENSNPFAHYAQTTGVIIGVVAVLLIVVVGTVIELIQKENT
jgi:hypothetical protein